MKTRELQVSLQVMQELIEELNRASYSYYQLDQSIMTDKQFDEKYDRLLELEKETNIIMVNSPTQKVQGYVLDSLEKVQHSKQMLSANKTKDLKEIRKFIGNNICVASWKLDGLTIVLRYKQGILDKAITRGSNGTIGEDVTHTIKTCKNVPLKLKYPINIEVRGECIIPWDEFERINATLEKPYSHPRNLAAGTVRQLDPEIAKQRGILFKAFELVQDDYKEDETINITESYYFMEQCGLDVVEHFLIDKNSFEETMNNFVPDTYKYPVDGIIVKYNNYLYGKSLGVTAHHPLDIIALKWEDELYETILRDVEWNTSRTGLINPVGIFDPIDLDGGITTKATLHNISYIENLQLGIGDTIQVYRANKVIPKIHCSIEKTNNVTIPNKCPCCGGEVVIKEENESKMLYCMNPGCEAKLLSKLNHFVGKEGLDIKGLSKSTLDKLIEAKFINDYKSIFFLRDHFREMIKMEGLGRKSVEKLLDSIEESKNTTVEKFVNALGIPFIGKGAAQEIDKFCKGNIEIFLEICKLDYFDWERLPDFGPIMHQSLNNYIQENKSLISELANLLYFNTVEISDLSSDLLKNQVFVITGDLAIFSNRNELVRKIESLGGKVTGSISKNTSYLICNKISGSSKCQKAQSLGIKIITEQQFVNLVEENE